MKMKNLVHITLAATLAAGAAAHSHHQHRHLHAKKHAGSPVEKREADAVTHWVVGATETVYELAGEKLDPEAAVEGIDGGDFVVVGESKPTYKPPPPPKPKTTKEANLGAQFIEKTSEAPKPTSVAPPPPPPPKPKPAKEKPEPIAGASGQGLNSKFPSGKVKCSEFPSQYGAVPLDWLKMDGWAGLQFVPGYSPSSLSISSIITGIAGQKCSKGCMCSYACPAGYQKTQWPEAQGNTKQSIGGLYCNDDGYLELTRKEFDTLCDPGVGGVSIQNDLNEVVSTCRTDYPGTESMVIPAIALPGGKVDICNPDQDNYYIWDGMSTSAQYYINKKGYGEKDACVWDSPIDAIGAGNWSPAILGVGRASDGITYISIFQNLPTSHAKLDFNIEIKGDVNSECSYINGKWSGGGDGCTTGMRSGGKAVIRYY